MQATTKKTEKQLKNAIFVHSALDQAELNVYEFRLLAHIARRGACFASLSTTAKICQMSVRKAQSTLKSLEQRGLIEKKQRKGRTDIYKLVSNLLDQLQKNQAIPELINDDEDELEF